MSLRTCSLLTLLLSTAHATNATAGSLNFLSQPDSKPGLDMTTAAMEAAMTDLMLGKTAFGATPMGGSVKKIEELITKDMMPKVLTAHSSDQKNLNRLANDIKKCGSVKADSLKKAQPSLKAYNKDSKDHTSCRTAEAVKHQSKTKCLVEQRALYKEKTLKCNYFATLSRNFGNQKNNRAIVTKAGSEKVEQYLIRISGTICGDHTHGSKGEHSKKGGWGGGLKNSMLDKYLRAKDACERAKKVYNAKVRECNRKIAAYKTQKQKCNQYQKLMDTDSCKHAVMVKDTCEAYAGCYYSRRKAYRTFERKVISDETDRKAEWRGLRRMECLIEAFADGKVTGAEVDTCKKKTIDTKLLNIKYPKIPPLAKCTIPVLYPATGEYKQKEFKPLPTLAKGAESQPCAGMDTIPTTPRKGSPATAKCVRVSLQGHYSAGPLVKCTNGIDVHKSLDKNSCPTGTKIFSPRSRDDWKTFLASAGPLRAPHWIIDVTRPQNGCGGCIHNPMNSGNKAQKTWSTVDGSPWWLRSSRYSEPNGDYDANCYLDLWQGKPRNENLVAFNDGRCNYHSKSYYCQLVHLNLKPKSGSPKSCKCSKVDLSGRYTAGYLIKCEQCITVYKSTQKNSCPNGMKIFSPASREDWKTVLASATPLRAPHWIIDVTRPQNGCGGCTRYPMRSTTPQQATWKTSDGTPWWLRNSRYSEPNGDYTANCYLDLWRPPTSPDTVTFNDWNCNYRSRSYYCQPTKSNKNYGGHHRRRRAPPPPKPKPAPKPATKAFKVGDSIQVKAAIKRPRYGWGSVRHGHCGPIKSLSSRWGKDAIVVDFPAQRGWIAKVSEMESCGGLQIPKGCQKNVDIMKLKAFGWKTWSDVAYGHRTKKSEIQPTSGECIVWASKRSMGDTKFDLAGFGRRTKIHNKNNVKENGLTWYTVHGKSNGFSKNPSLSLNSADVASSDGDCRLSWHLHRGHGVGGYRSGKTTGLNSNQKWRKVVMYGPCRLRH